jgi:hypothetical protein
MRVKLTNHCKQNIARKVFDEESFMDNSSMEHLYLCRGLLAVIQSMDDGYINVNLPTENGFVLAPEFGVGFNLGEYEVLT